MKSMFLPSTAKSSEDASRKRTISAITQWVKGRLSELIVGYQASQYQIMVTELQCNEPGCVPLETLVVILSMDETESISAISTEGQAKRTTTKPARRAEKVLKPLLEVTAEDINELIDTMYNVQSEDVGEGAVDVAATGTGSGSSAVIGTAVSGTPPAAPPVVNITRVTMVPNETTSTVSISWQAPTPTTLPQPPATVTAGATALTASAAPVPSTPASTTPTASTALSSADSSTSLYLPAPAPPSSASRAASATISPPAATAEGDFSHASATDSTHSSQDPVPAASAQPPKVTVTSTIAPRHKKDGTRPRGCPCCDPDNLDNIIDTMMFSHYPMT